MKLIKFLGAFAVIFAGLTMFQNCGGPMGNTDISSEDLAQLSVVDQSIALRKAHCVECHNPSTGVAEPRDILNDDALVSGHWVIPGNPEDSGMYKSLFSNMPLGRPALDSAQIQVFSAWIKGMANTGLKPAEILIAEAPAYNFGSVTTGEVAEKAFTLTNKGEQEALGLSGSLAAPFRFKGGSFPGQGGSCGAALAPNESCSVVVEFVPTAASDYKKTMKISYQDLESGKSVSISLEGGGKGVSRALLTVSHSPSYIFNTTILGDSSPQTFTITNIGAAEAKTVAVSLASTTDFQIQAKTCATSLAVNATCTVTVRFVPTNINSFTNSLRISYNDGLSTTQVALALSGKGVAKSSVFYSNIKAILASSCLDCHTTEFGTYSSLMAFKRSGTSPAITPSSAASRFIKRISQGPSQMGKSGFGDLADADRDKIIAWILAGAPNDPVVSPAVLSLDISPTLNFSSVTIGSKSEKTLQLTNSGGTKAESIAGAALPAGFTFTGGAFPGTGGNCSSTLAVGASCYIKVTFAPTAAVTYSGTLKVNYYSGKANANVSVSLAGVGKGTPIAILDFNVSDLDYGTLKANATLSKTLKVTNSGQTTAKSLSATGLSSGFAFAGNKYPGTGGTCATTLESKKSCNIVVTYKGTKEGKFSSKLNLNYNDGAANKVITVTMKSKVLADEPLTFQSIKGLFSSCLQCHSDFKSYDVIMKHVKSGMLLKRISGVYNGKPQMGAGDFGSLTAMERQMIQEWIKAGSPEFEKGSITQSYRPMVGDRHYIASVFDRVFGKEESVPFSKTILTKAELFGTACHRQDFVYDESTKTIAQALAQKTSLPLMKGDGSLDRCITTGTDDGRLNYEAVPMVTTISESLRKTTCMRLVHKTTAVKSALKLAKIAENADYTEKNITSLYQRFMPGSTPADDAVEALQALGATAVSNKNVKAASDSTKTLEGWRFIMMSICLSPQWQAP